MAPCSTLRNDGKSDCFKPRSYQIELLDKAMKKNIIVQLGTGSGKTFIAVLLIKEYALQLRASPKKGGKRAFFVVDKVALVEQQAEHIVNHVSLIVGKVHGSLNMQILENKRLFDHYIDAHQVIVITAQLLLDVITCGYLKITDIALLIFDECHHSLGKQHAYRKIMDRYFEVASDNRPRVLGLTASLIMQKTDPEKLEQSLMKLESIMDCSIETSCDLVTVSKYGTKPTELVVSCRTYFWKNAYCSMPLRVLDSMREFCKSSQVFHPDLQLDVCKPIVETLKLTSSILTQLGPWCGWKMAQVREKEMKQLRKQALLGDEQKEFLLLAETTLNTVKRLLEPKIKDIKKIDQLYETLPARIIRLFDILYSYNPAVQEEKLGYTENLSAVVFVNERYVAYVMRLLLKTIAKMDPEKFGFIKADYVIGNQSRSLESEASQALHKRLEDVLRKFRKGELNVLVATNVLEEGVDVRHCNLVVKFDRPRDYRSYVQSKGRARKPGAKYVVLVEDKDVADCSSDMAHFTQIEKILLKRSRTVHNPSNDGEVPPSVDDLVEHYVVPSTGARLMLSTAIPLINKYCAKLPSDIFTRLVPQSKIIPVEVDNHTEYRAELLLPMNSPLKTPITIDKPVPSKKLAQMLVAFEASKKLHEMGELNDHLLPVGKEAVLSLLDDDMDEFVPSHSARVGSAKRKQLYDKKTAAVLHDALPVKREQLFLYVLDIDLIHPISLQDNPRMKNIINPKETDFSFGFLSRRRIPKVPAFPAFLRHGESRVSVKEMKDKVTLDEQTLTYLRHFHHYIFKNVLQLTKDALSFQLDENTPMATLIVPLGKVRVNGSVEYSIKMDYVKAVVHSMGEMPRVPQEEERKKFKFNVEEWKNTVVMPWYRNVESPIFFYVVDVLKDHHPSSPFPDSEYETFNEYFRKKYEIEIYDQDQPLLEVEYTSNRLNLLLPRMRVRSRSRPSSSATSVAPGSVIPSQKQILVPELLDTHPISAHLWNSIAALPSFFYRMNALLVADELRLRVLVEALNIPIEDASVPDSFEWPPLTYPSTQEEKHSLMVTKLDQLREPRRGKGSASSVKSNQEDQTYEIGVWDPSVAAEFATEPCAQMKVDGWLEDTVGLTPDPASITAPGGDLSDDDDEEHSMFFNLSEQLKDRAEKFATPRVEEIAELGWGDLPPEGEEQKPFMLIGSDASKEINLSSLMTDLAGVFMPPPQLSPPSTSSRKPAPPNPKAFIPKQLLEMWEGPCEDEVGNEKDSSLWKKEECVDLISFDDEPDVTVHAREEKDSSEEDREEIELLDMGEKQKEQRDLESLACQHELSKGEVLAPSITPSFSFKCASPLMVDAEGLFSSGAKGGQSPYGVCPSLILTALTTSNANDGMNLERLETIGDSFLKFAVTDFLYHAHPHLHEGKLSYARSKEVSNCNLYRLGRKLNIPNIIIGAKFDVQEAWLPPCYVPCEDFKAPNREDAASQDEMMEKVLDGDELPKEVHTPSGWDEAVADEANRKVHDGIETINLTKSVCGGDAIDDLYPLPYNKLTQQYISDKSIADCVEALIGAHLLTLGPDKTLHMMKWMGVKVMTTPIEGEKPLLHFVDTPTNPNCAELQLKEFFNKFDLCKLEESIGYRFNDKAYLLQAFTHASYYPNRITGCYQRLEFLGDAVLDYMITRFLFEHEKQYSPGVLTDLRSALVNNTIFASLAVKYEFNKHFVAMCPGLHFMIEKFVRLCKEKNLSDSNFHSEMYMVTTEEEIDEGQEEDVEVPKAMGDIFESIAGAVYLDCGRNLDVVWRVFYNLMKDTIYECCTNPPRSPIRELLEREHDKAKFSKVERIQEAGKVRVTVEVGGGKIRFTGMGRNYRIAKTTAAKRALRYLKTLDAQKKREEKKLHATQQLII